MSKANNEALTTFGFDLNQPDAAATATAEMAALPSTANGDKAEQNASKTIRNEACIHLKELVG